ncbi:HET-domain-containing protein [Hyaloscypha variabilis F]|uniref:HET-domain-containing protein n=1 Tax=Hyaloscypha variabilis (strain UAMH 11265 / GT02V1 / F) TaxID=1149755 RepID=A0A2J6QYM9_HYAVF|nr:HET-domain-containing protein [Hyaloscypha variabilis F]
MRLIDVEKKKLEEFIGGSIPPYAILSHTWGTNEDEILYEDIEQGNVNKSGPQLFKFEACCKQAFQDGLRYAWIDTCCIPRSDFTELGEAINSMFRWYKNAAVCYAYLADVPAGVDCSDPNSKFFTSRWFTRGWTLQELLAPKEVRFYDAAWNFLGTKGDMSIAIETITGIPRPVLQGWASLNTQSVAQRMSWASKRVTKRPEDIAYCLLGLFSVYLSMIYGEGAEEAFSRLQQKIMTEVRDDSILAWGLNLEESAPKRLNPVLSAGALARSPSDFANCRRIRSRQRYIGPMHSLEISGGCLSVKLQLHEEENGDIYGALNCGPDDIDDEVVVIPLYAVSSESSEYIRPKCRLVQLRNKKSLKGSPKLIYIHKDQKNGDGQLANRQHWFYVEESIETNLELIDVQPRSRWQKNHGMIMTTNEPGSDVTERSLTRFRAKMGGCSDVVVILEFTLSNAQPLARCHVMTCSTDTDLDDLRGKLQYMRRKAFGKQGASNGRFNVKATVAKMSVAGQQMFVLRLATAETLSEPTVNATRELSQVNTVLGIIKILQQEQVIGQKQAALHEDRSELSAELQRQKQRLTVVQEEIRKLIDEKDVLQKAIKAGDSTLFQQVVKGMELNQHQEVLKKSKGDFRNHLRDLLDKELDTYSGPGQWIEAVAEMLVNSPDIQTDVDADDVAKCNSGSDQNTAKAAENIDDVHQHTPPSLDKKERQAIAKLLLEESVTTVPEDWKGTPLGWIAANGLKSVIQLHQQIHQTPQPATGSKQNLSYEQAEGTNVDDSRPLSLERLASAGIDEADESGRTPLSYAAGSGHKDIVEILLDGGAFIHSRDREYRAPLLYAELSGHEDVVKVLLDRGADRELLNEINDTPEQLARLSGPARIENMVATTSPELKEVEWSSEPARIEAMVATQSPKLKEVERNSRPLTLEEICLGCFKCVDACCSGEDYNVSGSIEPRTLLASKSRRVSRPTVHKPPPRTHYEGRSQKSRDKRAWTPDQVLGPPEEAPET